MLNGIMEDKFLSEVMEKYCYNVVDLEQYFDSSIPYEGFHTSEIEKHSSFGTVRINAIDQAEYVKKLSLNRWNYICTEVEYLGTKSGFTSHKNLSTVVKAAKNFYCDVLEGKDNLDFRDYFFLHESFKSSRFYLDEYISNEIADLVKLKWMENISNGDRQCDVLILSQSNDKKESVGFVSLYCGSDIFRFGVIDLICTNDIYRLYGIASLMLYEAFQFFNGLTVKTQLNNIEANEFYLKCGFKPINHYMVFHKHSS